MNTIVLLISSFVARPNRGKALYLHSENPRRIMSMKSSLALLFTLCPGTAAGAQTLNQVFAFDCPGILQKCRMALSPDRSSRLPTAIFTG